MIALRILGRAAAGTLLGVLVVATSVHAAGHWTMSVAPGSVTQGQSTGVVVRVTNISLKIGIRCAVVSVPSAFAVLGAGVTGTTANSPWSATTSPAGDGGTLVSIFNPDELGKLQPGDWVDATVTVRGDVPGTYGWTGIVFHDPGCWEQPVEGAITRTVTIVGSAPPPPPPPPPPAAAPTPTQSSTAPVAPAPNEPAPSGTPDGTPRPAAAADDEPTAPTRAPDDDEPDGASPDDESRGGGGARPTPGSAPETGARPGAGAAPRIEVAGPAEDVPVGGGILASSAGFAALSLLDDLHVWFVPGVAVGVPGLLLLVVVAVQMAGGALWIPLTRRLVGRERARLVTAERMWWED